MKRLLLILLFLLSLTSPVYAMTPGEAYLELTNTKVVWMIQPLQPFQSVEELQTFLDDYDGNLLLAMRQHYLHEIIDCDDYAFALRDYARSKGYDMETEIFYRGDWFINHKLSKDHIACKVFIGNWVYVVDPVNKSIWQSWWID